ncbi:MAG: histidine phosphatase family protein [Dethiobacter sp.]|jgi:alpha-ribazole phosphatase/probable phosphoglycerate mutase|nr:histidine phosphatase family protein [Dethiobacter sp.]
MTVLRLIFVRHGETQWNREYRIQGSSEVSLNSYGVLQSQQVANALSGPVQRIYISPQLRAREFAAPLAERHGIMPQIAEGLKEMCFGRWEGLRYADMDSDSQRHFTDWSIDPLKYSPPDGESLQQLADRVDAALAEIISGLKDGSTCVAISHGGVIRTAVALLLGMQLPMVSRIKIDTASITVLEEMPGLWKLALLNDTCHLRLPTEDL